MSNKDKIILHLCSGIGSDSQPYVDAGYNVIRVGKDTGVENFKPPEGVYGIIANPPCTEFSWAKCTGEPRDLERGMFLVKECLRVIWECQYRLSGPYSKKTNLKFWVLENPCGLMQYFMGKPLLEYSPWEYGDSYKKKTHLWGYFNSPEKVIRGNKGLPKFDSLKTKQIHPEYYGVLTRQERRSICSEKFAKAFFEVNQ